MDQAGAYVVYFDLKAGQTTFFQPVDVLVYFIML